jgi:iron complex transport system substrate-binding protein
MKKIALTLVTVFVAVILFLVGCSTGLDTAAKNSAEGMTVTDSLGRTVNVPADGAKFVAIGPGCLRLYCYVGDVAEIVGVEQTEITNGTAGRPYAKAYEELLSLPIIGPGGPNNAPDAEKIIEVAPDVIFSTYNSDAASLDELQDKTQIPVVALSYGETEVFDPVLDSSLELIGKITAEEARAAEVIQFFAACKEDLASRTQGIAQEDRPSAYLGGQSMRGKHGIESTSGNYPLFTAVNVRNVVDEAGINQYIMLDKEKLLDMDPDIIFMDSAGLPNIQEDYRSNPMFYQGLSAFNNGKLYMQLTYKYYATNIDIALCNAYYIGSIIYPERFSDVDIVAKSNEIFSELLGEELYAEVAEEYFGGFQQLSFE